MAKLSLEQQAVVDSQGDVIVNAIAGSGKTHSLLEYCRKQKGNGVYVAYNNVIAQEVRRKAPSNTEVTTAHSLAYRYWSSKGKRPNIGFITVKNLESYFEDTLCKPQFLNLIKFSLEKYSNSDLSEQDYFQNNHYYMQPRGGIKMMIEDMRNGKLPLSHDMYLKFYSELKLDLNKHFFVWDEF